MKRGLSTRIVYDVASGMANEFGLDCAAAVFQQPCWRRSICGADNLMWNRRTPSMILKPRAVDS
jgi:hypothetical protein